MNHATKIPLRIIMIRIRKKIKPKMAAEQSGFVQGKDIADGIFMLTTLTQRELLKHRTTSTYAS